MSSLGYHCFETWGSVMQALDAKGTLADLLSAYPIPFRSAFMGVNVHDPAKLKDSLAQVIAWGKVTRKYGGTFAVVNAGGVDRAAFDFKAARAQHRLRAERSRQGAATISACRPACISTPAPPSTRATRSTR